MMTANLNAGITRRGFIQVGSVAALAAGMPNAATTESALPSASLRRNIALEEHFDFPVTASGSYAAPGSPEFQRQIQDLGSGRIAEMDRRGVELCILSLVGPGIQTITNPRQAAEVARQANDHLAENIANNPKRLKGFARGL
jgi:predicted TIM-barrel fold metal-dependent hydrolase